MDLVSIEIHEQRVVVHLHATSPIAVCPQCATAGSRVHSCYQRTITDVAFGGRSLVLTLLVRKWICPEVSCSRKIFSEKERAALPLALARTPLKYARHLLLRTSAAEQRAVALAEAPELEWALSIAKLPDPWWAAFR